MPESTLLEPPNPVQVQGASSGAATPKRARAKRATALCVDDIERMLRRLQELDLPAEDGIPMESDWHYSQAMLLRMSVYALWRDRTDYYFGTNMFLYYSLKQAQQIIRNVRQGKGKPPRFKGPDFFLVTGVDGTKRRDKWVVWEEEGRYPDLIVEFISYTTKRKDKEANMELYAKVFRTPEYFWYDEAKADLKGYRLQSSTLEYQPIAPNERGWLWSEVLGAYLGVWEGELLQRRRYRWLRLFDKDGNLVLIDEERELQARQQVEQARQQVEQERQRAEAAERRIAELEAELRRLRGE